MSQNLWFVTLWWVFRSQISNLTKCSQIQWLKTIAPYSLIDYGLWIQKTQQDCLSVSVDTGRPKARIIWMLLTHMSVSWSSVQIFDENTCMWSFMWRCSKDKHPERATQKEAVCFTPQPHVPHHIIPNSDCPSILKPTQVQGEEKQIIALWFNSAKALGQE